MLIVGEKEQAENAVAVRSRKEGDKGAMKFEEFLSMIQEEVATRAK